MIVKFYDRDVKPPKGGWHYVVNGQRIEGHSEGEVIGRIKQVRVNNGTYVSDKAIEAELWDYLCSRQPERCGRVNRAPDQQRYQNIYPRDITPAVYGPWIWQFLNFAAVRFDRDFFLHLCQQLVRMIDCPECRSEWQSILSADSPKDLSNAFEASHWVNKQHNRVNRKLGKPEYPYVAMIREYGAPSKP